MCFGEKNNAHNVDWFFTTHVDGDIELDPYTHVFVNRAMQLRRMADKKISNITIFKANLSSYSKQAFKTPAFFDNHGGDATPTYEDFPRPKFRRGDEHRLPKYDNLNQPQGPVGLLLESVAWNGMLLDKDFRIWQHDEEPLDILQTPYQHLKTLLTQAASRARTQAEYYRGKYKTDQLLEIDIETTNCCKGMDDEAKAITKTINAGGDMSKEKVAQFNEDIENTCAYCMDGPASDVHTRWTCKAFKEERALIDPELAAIPTEFLPYCIQCGVAPALTLDGNNTF